VTIQHYTYTATHERLSNITLTQQHMIDYPTLHLHSNTWETIQHYTYKATHERLSNITLTQQHMRDYIPLTLPNTCIFFYSKWFTNTTSQSYV